MVRRLFQNSFNTLKWLINSLIKQLSLRSNGFTVVSRVAMNSGRESGHIHILSASVALSANPLVINCSVNKLLMKDTIYKMKTT